MCKKSGPLKEEGMHAGAMVDKFAFANLLRKTQTPQEEKLWEFLKIRPKDSNFEGSIRLRITYLTFIVIELNL